MLKRKASLEERVKSGELQVSDDFNIWNWIHAAAYILLISTFIGFLGDFYWFFDLFSQFRIQYCIISFLFMLVLLVIRRYDQRYILMHFIVFMVNVVFFVPFFIGKPNPEVSGQGPYRALLLNLKSSNLQKDLVRKYILNESADFVTLLEVNQSWYSHLKSVDSVYPHMKFVTREDNFGVAVLSKFPIVYEDVRYLGEADVPTIHIGADVEGKILQLVATHPVPPSSEVQAKHRDTQLRLLADIAKPNHAAILMGDLNVVSWNSKYKKLLSRSNLSDSMIGFGIQTTWPSFTSMLGIPIDHILVSKEIRLLDRDVGKYVGSDHLPVIIEFMIDSRFENKVTKVSKNGLFSRYSLHN